MRPVWPPTARSQWKGRKKKERKKKREGEEEGKKKVRKGKKKGAREGKEREKGLRAETHCRDLAQHAVLGSTSSHIGNKNMF